MRTLIALSITALSVSIGHSAQAGQVNLPGDMVSSGGHYIKLDNAYSEWQTSGEFITNSSALDEDDRQQYSVRDHGNRWQHSLTYFFGLTDNWNLGLEQGYAESRWHHSQEDDALNPTEGSFESAGETDLTLLLRYGLAKGASLNFDLSPPIAGANQARSNTTDSGQQGDEGRGYTQLGTEVAANWITELGTHWLGSIRLDLTTRDKVNGEGVTGPWCAAFNFGSNISLTESQNLVFQWHLMRGFPYKSYNAALDKEISYGDQSRFGFNTEYQWDLTDSLQLQSYLKLAMTQPPVQKFSQAGAKQRVELTGGTYTTLGLALKAEF